MTKQSALAGKLAATAGQGTQSTEHSAQSTEEVTTRPLPKWERDHAKMSFYLPRDVLAELDAEAKRTGRSKSRIVTDLLREHLKLEG
jgi:hypothetical protein